MVKALDVVKEIIFNEEYKDLKKEILIKFGFNEIKLKTLIDWLNFYCCDEYFDEIEVNPDIEDIPVDLLTKEERNLILNNYDEDTVVKNAIAHYSMDNEEAVHLANSQRRKERFKIVNRIDWLKIGQQLKYQRLELGISLSEMGRIIKTSPSRIANFENGKAVLMADNLKASYELVLESKQLSNVLNTFIDEYELHNLFEKYINNLKGMQENDWCLKDVFGDLNEFMKKHYESERI